MTSERMYGFCIPNEFDGWVWRRRTAYGVSIRRAVTFGMGHYGIVCFLFGKMRNIGRFREGSVDVSGKFYDFILRKLDVGEAESERRDTLRIIREGDFVIRSRL